MKASTGLGAQDTFQAIVKIHCGRFNRLQKETDNDLGPRGVLKAVSQDDEKILPKRLPVSPNSPPSPGEFVSQNLVQASLLLKSYLLSSPSLTDLIVFLYAPVESCLSL